VALYEEALRRILAVARQQEVAEPPHPAYGPLAQIAVNALALYPVSLDEAVPGALNPEWLEEFHRLSRPDADHKRHGRWYTPRPIARYMARRALEMAALRRPMDNITVLDPACGCGALLVPVFEEVVAFHRRREPRAKAPDVVRHSLEHIIAADVDPRALETALIRLNIAAERLAGERIHAAPQTYCGDTLTVRPAAIAPEGVDVVVMNPPYLGNRYFASLKNPEKARIALRKAFGWNDDLYAHFLHRAWDWLRPGGCVCAITSDTFLTIASKARTRDTLRTHALREIVRVPASAFAASVNTCITLAVRAEPELFDTIDYVDAREAPEEAWETLETEPPPKGVERLHVPAQAYADPTIPFFRPTPRAVDLYNRYFAETGSESRVPSDDPYTRHPAPGTQPPHLCRLGEVAPAKDCGINSGNVRHRIFFIQEAPGLRKLIQGRQLERYIVRWDSPNAQYKWVDIDYQPDPERRGQGRGGRESPHAETWGFRGELGQSPPAERLFLRQTEDDLFAAYLRQSDDDPVYTDNTLHTLLLTDAGRALGLTYHYLLGLLNSAFLNELYHLLSQEEGRAQAQVKVAYVNRLPIAVPTAEQREEVEHWVYQAIEAQEMGQPITAIQWQLDTLVAGLYQG
jgi:methylase of polypeptide subunit release factors